MAVHNHSVENFLSLLDKNQLTIDCLTQYCWNQAQISNGIDEAKRDRSLANERIMRAQLEEQIFCQESIDIAYFRALNDLIEAIENTTDDTFRQILATSSKSFHAVTFDCANEYYTFAFPLSLSFSMHAFNRYMEKVMDECTLRNIETTAKPFQKYSYLKFVNNAGKSLTQMHKTRDQMLLSWANTAE